MFNNFKESLENFIPPLREKRAAEELAYQAESAVRKLSGLPPANSDDKDLIPILKSICSLLERLPDRVEQIDRSEPPSAEPNQTITTPSTTEEIQPPLEPPPAPEIVRETPVAKPSATANELIRLRDWVLLAKTGSEEEKASPQSLEAIYKQLGRILTKEGITAVEETGNFNDERQQAVSTQVTDCQEKDDLVCDTVRPGYLFNGNLIRPQEVVVYTYEAVDSGQEQDNITLI
jgi:GrpE